MSRMLSKIPKSAVLSRAEKRAASIDSWVKKHLAECREADASKTSRLRALREARKAAPTETEPNSAKPSFPGSGYDPSTEGER